MLAMAAVPLPAHAQSDPAASPVSSSSQPSQIASPPTLPDDIVVTAPRYGEARIAAESEFEEAEIAGYGADTVQDLMNRLSPLIDPSGTEPVLLVNGRPAGFDRSILAYPPEALTRLAVLKPEAGAQYGAAPGQRVVNLILKPRFASLDADMGGSWATAGGQYGGRLGVARTAIRNDTRWNISAQFGRDSALFRSARDVPAAVGAFDSVGFVSGVGGKVIDLGRGSSATVTAIPAAAMQGAATLDDFAATAGQSHTVDPNAYETLQSSRRTIGINAGVTRPVGALSASLSFNVLRSGSDGWRGLPMASVLLPAINPWSPFGADVLLTRPFAGTQALRNDSKSTALGATFTLGGIVHGWLGSLALGLARTSAESLLETGIDTTRVQQLLANGDAGFNPFGVWENDLLLGMRTRSRMQNLTVRLNLQKKILDLPAGPAGLSLAVNAGRYGTYTERRNEGGALIEADDVTRRQIDAKLGLNIAIARRGMAGIGFVGDLAFDGSVGMQDTTGSHSQKRYSAGMSWSPFTVLQLRAATDHVEMAPSIDQLDGPVITVTNRIFDYARQEIVEPLWITGGNPMLGRGTRRSLSLTALLRPLGNETVSLNLGYRHDVAKGLASAFPELTPAIEAAFPDRVMRDDSGRLISVDARPINIADNTTSQFSSSVALRFPPARTASQKRESPAGDPIQLGLSFNYQLRIRDEMLIREGVPPIDRLRGGGGVSRHGIGLQFNAGNRLFGVNLSANWNSAARIAGTDAANYFRVRPPLLLNFSTFVNVGKIDGRWTHYRLPAGLKWSLDVQNLLNGYRHVALVDESAPAGYAHDEVDPLGRTIRLTLRNRF